MTKKTSTNRATEVSLLANRLRSTIQFVETAQDFPAGPTIRNLVGAAEAKNDLRTLRLICRDVDAMLIALAPSQRAELDTILRQQLGVDRDAEKATFDRQIAAILDRGSIASERERRRLEDYLAMLQVSGGDQELTKRVLHLLGKA